jgi:hypothetical protein
LLVNLTRIEPELTVPESITALAPRVPEKDQTYPVAAALVIFSLVSVDEDVSAGATKRYTLDPHSTIDTGIAVIVAGATGGNKVVLDNFTDLLAPSPQLEVYRTRTLSPATAPALLVNLTRIEPELTVPESIMALAPKLPVKDHTYPVACALVTFCLISVVTGVSPGAV